MSTHLPDPPSAEEAARLAALTAGQLPELAGLAILPITGGGLDRRYFRIEGEAGSIILMTYTDARPDNAKFVASTGLFQDLGIRVPKLLASDEGEMVLWLEDLGEDDLFAAAHDGRREERAKLYARSLEAILPLHQAGADDLSPETVGNLEPPFDESLYRWEQDYFLEHFVARLTVDGADAAGELRADPGLRTIRESLSALPRRLVHRDFQSRNVMLTPDGEIAFVDHQGVRLGRPEYDLASLLYDPYVGLGKEERRTLAEVHLASLPRDIGATAETYRACALQRLMQALGAFGNLALNGGMPEFLQHIPPALTDLRPLAQEVPGAGSLSALEADS